MDKNQHDIIKSALTEQECELVNLFRAFDETKRKIIFEVFLNLSMQEDTDEESEVTTYMCGAD